MFLCALMYIIVIIDIKHNNCHYCNYSNRSWCDLIQWGIRLFAMELWSITHVPSGAALCSRRSPTETSDRAVRETDRILLGSAVSAHAVPEHAGWRRWQSAPRRVANSALQMMHLKPNACMRPGRPDARVGIGCGILCPLDTEQRHWVCGKREIRRVHEYIQNTPGHVFMWPERSRIGEVARNWTFRVRQDSIQVADWNIAFPKAEHRPFASTSPSATRTCWCASGNFKAQA